MSKLQRFSKILINKLKGIDLGDLAATLAYYLLLSIFPFLIFLLNLLALLTYDLKEPIMNFLALLPDELSIILKSVIDSLMNSSSSALLSISIIMAIWSGSNGMIRLYKKINAAFGGKERLSFIKLRIIGILMTLALSFLLLLLVILKVFGRMIIDFLEKNITQLNLIRELYDNFSTLLPLLMMILVFTLLFKAASFRKGKKKPYVKTLYALAGGAFTSFSWLAFTQVFSFYVNNFSNYDKTYGSLGALIVLMIFLFTSSITIMLGAYIAASLEAYEEEYSKKKSVYAIFKNKKDKAIK